MIGLKRGVVKLVPYNKNWINFFNSEKKILEKNLSGNSIFIEHAGSTAIPGLSAKPIIDIWVGAKAVKTFKKIVPNLEKSGYSQVKNSKAPNVHLVFAKGSELKGTTHYLHLVKYKGKIWNDTLFFRDWLRLHKNSAKKYAALKLNLSKKYPNNRMAYIRGKSNFILSITRKAKQ